MSNNVIYQEWVINMNIISFIQSVVLFLLFLLVLFLLLKLLFLCGMTRFHEDSWGCIVLVHVLKCIILMHCSMLK